MRTMIQSVVVLVLLVLLGRFTAAAAQLPPEIEADRYLLQAEQHIEKQDYAAAMSAMDQILRLQEEHDLTIPEAFYFRYAQVSERVGLHDKAIEYVTRYLTGAGQDSEFYREALQLLNAAEEEATRPAGQSQAFDGVEFVWVPAGEFRMGSTSSEAGGDEQPVTRVRISRGFWLGKYEVTQGQWEAVMGSNPSSFDQCGPNCPVENVSWEDVQEFIGRLNAMEGAGTYRLPTEAEWEYAARAGTTGDRYGSLNAVAWCGDNSGNRTHPVGQKAPNAWGLYDMLGNVWEWVQDWEGDYPGGTVTDPQGPASGSYRVYRGGSFNGGFCRSSYRGGDAPGNRFGSLGFRLLRTE